MPRIITAHSMHRVLILANPIAGSGRARRRAEQLADSLRVRGADATLHFTGSADDLRARAAAASGGQWHTVVPVGGDGTVRTAAAALPDDSPRLALLPSGTANVLARELRLPRHPDAVAAMIVAGTSIPFPMFEADGERFLQFLGVGFDAAMVVELESGRSGPLLGRIGWVLPVLRVVARLPLSDLTLHCDDGRRIDGLTQVLATRVRNYGGAFRLPPEVGLEPVDALHVLCFRQRSRWQWLRTALRAWWSGMRAGRDCELLQARSLRVEAREPAHTQIDGDSLGATPVTMRPADRPPLRLAVPPDHPKLDRHADRAAATLSSAP